MCGGESEGRVSRLEAELEAQKAVMGEQTALRQAILARLGTSGGVPEKKETRSAREADEEAGADGKEEDPFVTPFRREPRAGRARTVGAEEQGPKDKEQHVVVSYGGIAINLPPNGTCGPKATVANTKDKAYGFRVRFEETRRGRVLGKLVHFFRETSQA